jgi:hypothetical protein
MLSKFRYLFLTLVVLITFGVVGGTLASSSGVASAAPVAAAGQSWASAPIASRVPAAPRHSLDGAVVSYCSPSVVDAAAQPRPWPNILGEYARLKGLGVTVFLPPCDSIYGKGFNPFANQMMLWAADFTGVKVYLQWPLDRVNEIDNNMIADYYSHKSFGGFYLPDEPLYTQLPQVKAFIDHVRALYPPAQFFLNGFGIGLGDYGAGADWGMYSDGLAALGLDTIFVDSYDLNMSLTTVAHFKKYHPELSIGYFERTSNLWRNGALVMGPISVAAFQVSLIMHRAQGANAVALFTAWPVPAQPNINGEGFNGGPIENDLSVTPLYGPIARALRLYAPK